MALRSTPAVLLRAYPYSESSRVLRFFTRDLGVVGVMARGIRRSGGREGTGAESFAGGVLTLYVKPSRELHNLKDFAAVHPRRTLGASPLRLGAASVVAEIILRHAGEEANVPLFEAFERGLDRLAEVDESAVAAHLVAEAWTLVGLLGYRPVLDACAACGGAFDDRETGRFDFAAGGVRCAACSGSTDGPRVGPGARAQLAALADGQVPRAGIDRPTAHLRLLSDFVAYHLPGAHGLESVAFVSRLLPTDHA